MAGNRPCSLRTRRCEISGSSPVSSDGIPLLCRSTQRTSQPVGQLAIADRMGDAGAVTGHPTHATPSPTRERRQLCLLVRRGRTDRTHVVRRLARRGPAGPLVLREGHPAALGIAVKPLARWQAHVQRQLQQQPFPDLVDRLGTGRPVYSPLRPDKVDAPQHFRVLRPSRGRPTGADDWQPRTCADKDQKLLWRLLATRGSTSCATPPLGVTLKDNAGNEIKIRDERASHHLDR